MSNLFFLIQCSHIYEIEASALFEKKTKPNDRDTILCFVIINTSVINQIKLKCESLKVSVFPNVFVFLFLLYRQKEVFSDSLSK